MKQTLIFLGGLAAGGLVGWFASKKFHESKLDEELESMKEYYISKERGEEAPEKKTEKAPEGHRRPVRPSLESLRKKYVSPDMTRPEGNSEALEAEFEHPVDSDEDEEEFIGEHTKEEWDSIGHEQMEEDRERSKMEPKIISVDDYGELPGFDATELIYYQENDILEDEDGNEIDERRSLLGECMTKYAFEDSDEEDLFVRNYRLATDYHIHKIVE